MHQSCKHCCKGVPAIEWRHAALVRGKYTSCGLHPPAAHTRASIILSGQLGPAAMRGSSGGCVFEHHMLCVCERQS
jgi:hypothetical protein